VASRTITFTGFFLASNSLAATDPTCSVTPAMTYRVQASLDDSRFIDSDLQIINGVRRRKKAMASGFNAARLAERALVRIYP